MIARILSNRAADYAAAGAYETGVAEELKLALAGFRRNGRLPRKWRKWVEFELKWNLDLYPDEEA
jgi:hypothetical protein